jgi:allophanate hydrolase subunit 2
VSARVAVTGATATIRLDGRDVRAAVDGPPVDVAPVDVAPVDVPAQEMSAGGVSAVVDVPAGGVLEIGRAVAGVRSYVAVAGGIDVEPVLGSRSTDTLSGLGPPRLVDGMTLPVGAAGGGVSGDIRRPAHPSGGGELVLGVRLGPRDDWFVDARVLFAEAYTVSPVGNRVGARLAGPGLTRAGAGELPPEGVVLGAIQVPADGQPLIFLADHPVTGGYPVIGVVDDVTPLAQARPGTAIRFRALG